MLGVFNDSLTTVKHWLKHRNEGSPGCPPTILATAEAKRALWEQLESNALRAQQRAERAEQEALREATRQLRERMDAYLKELSEADTWPRGGGGGGIRRVK